VDANLQWRDGDATDKEKIRTTVTGTEKERARARVRATRLAAVAGSGGGAKTMMTEVAVEATAITGGVDTVAATMMMATTMTRLNVCDALTEEKDLPSNPSRMHATIK